MAAVLQNQLRRFEQSAKPYLYEGPFTSQWGFVEQKTKLKRDQIALVLLGVGAIYLAFGWGNDFLCNLIGFLYPAYASLLTIEAVGTSNDTKWLVYWVIYATFGFVEYLASDFVQSLYFYWLGKCFFLLWLMPAGPTGGSNVLYQRLIRPLLLKLRPTVTKSASEDAVYTKSVPTDAYYTSEYTSMVNN